MISSLAFENQKPSRKISKKISFGGRKFLLRNFVCYGMWHIILHRNELELHSVMYLNVNIDDYNCYGNIVGLSHQWKDQKIKQKNMRNNGKKTEKHGNYGEHCDY